MAAGGAWQGGPLLALLNEVAEPLSDRPIGDDHLCQKVVNPYCELTFVCCTAQSLMDCSRRTHRSCAWKRSMCTCRGSYVSTSTLNTSFTNCRDSITSGTGS